MNIDINNILEKSFKKAEHNGIVGNLKDNCSKSVKFFIVNFYAKSTDYKMYFKSNVGINIGFRKSKKYDKDMFAGYFGFGKYNGRMLSTSIVKNYIKDKEILRFDFTKIAAFFEKEKGMSFYSEGKVKIEPYNDNSNNNNNKLYYCKNMQYNRITTTQGSESVFAGFEEVIKNYTHIIRASMQTEIELEEINYHNVEAIEIILPQNDDFEASFLVVRLLFEALDKFYNMNFVRKNYIENDFKELYKCIADKVKDYEVEKISESTVEKWINQFKIESTYKYDILYELNYILDNYYFSRKKIYNELKALLVDNKYGLFSNNVKSITFINSNQKGTSQDELLKISEEILKDKLNISLKDCHSDKVYLYIDDCIFTGNTVINDIKDFVENSKIHENSYIYIFTLAQHKKNIKYINDELKKMHNNIKMFTAKQISENENLKPMFIENIEVAKYILSLKNEKYSSNMYYKGKDIYRSETNRNNEKLFRNFENRDIIEKNFTVYGTGIIKDYKNENRRIKQSIRPLGYEKLVTLGFGSMFITFRNIANCCPLVLWAETNNWKPLIKRKINMVKKSNFND